MMKIGIYGGTFNPVHNGHIKLAENAKRLCELDKVIFLPSGDSYMKSNVLPGHQRYQMVSLALKGMDRMEVSDLEIRRRGASYSFETMEEFRCIYPEEELFFLLGEDSLRMIELWKEPSRLMRQCNLIVATRKPDASNRQYYPDDTFTGAAADNQDVCAVNMELWQYIRYLEEKYHTRIYCINMQNMISSSQIREAAAAGKPIDGMVPDEVRDYINQQHLYQSAEVNSQTDK